MGDVDGAQALVDKLNGLGLDAYPGPRRPPSQHIEVEAIFVNDQGGLPPAPYLNEEGTYSIKYYDVWVRSRTVEAGRALNSQIKEALHLGDFLYPIISCFYIMAPVYSGRDRGDNHLWRCPFKVKMFEAK